MTKKLLQNLFLTFILSLLLTALLYSIWFSSRQRGFEERQAMTLLLAVGDLFQNLLLTIASLPILFLKDDRNYNKLQTRILLYFSGPVLLTLIFVLFIGNSSGDKIGFLLPGLSFVSIHTYFYFQLMRFRDNETK